MSNLRSVRKRRLGNSGSLLRLLRNTLRRQVEIFNLYVCADSGEPISAPAIANSCQLTISPFTVSSTEVIQSKRRCACTNIPFALSHLRRQSSLGCQQCSMATTVYNMSLKSGERGAVLFHAPSVALCLLHLDYNAQRPMIYGLLSWTHTHSILCEPAT